MVQTHILGHVIRRGIEAVRSSQDDREFYVEQLKKAAQVYEDAGPDMKIMPRHLLPMVITGVVFVLLLTSIRYTLGEVVATLVMIEQPATVIKTTTVRDTKDLSDPDASKGRLIDEEVTLFKQDPITTDIRKTIKHLHSIGGYAARWRGLGISIVYHMAHSFASHFMGAFLGPNPIFGAITYVVSSVLLSRIHMTWTHIMISNPSAKPWFKRIPSEREMFKTLALPSFVYATAQLLTIGLPIIVFVAGGHPIFKGMSDASDSYNLAARIAISLFTMLAWSVLILLPASVTLTRIEASLLPADQDTIVAFDRTLNGAASSGRSLFATVWKSFSRASAFNIIKFYTKMVRVYVIVVFTGVHLIVAEAYLIGFERLNIFAQAVHAQLQLMAMGVDQY